MQDKRDADGPDLNVKAQGKKREVKSDDEEDEEMADADSEGRCALQLCERQRRIDIAVSSGDSCAVECA